MVGRVTELRRLRDAYDQSVRDRTCQLFTILGNAGVGKSRLVHEFLDGLDATVVRGGCLSYGDGITYWPVVDVIKQLTAATPTLELDTELASLLSQESFAAPSHQIAWSFRKLLEDTAQERPLVVVFDDLQWAEPTFLDLIEHVADLSRDAPILLLCMARPDLLDKRQTWAGGKLNATNLLLEPLSGMETAEMVSQLVGEMSDDIGRRVVEAAEGNPLFVEEMVALVRDSGDENVRVPPTIHALLAARLDQLDAHEREVLERGSVEGRLFHRGAVEALSPERADGEVSTRLTSLVRKDLLRPDKAELPGEDAFRFRHLLIRDAAYDALPKSVRADLHERFARWLEEFGADMAEIDEITGYHLEQACTYRLDLGREVDPNLAASARRKLVAAGRRAALRGDYGAAANLLRRADQLPGPPDVTVRMDLMSTMFFGEQGTAAAKLAQQHLAQALATSDKRTELCARIEIEYMSTFREPEGATDRLVAAADEAAKTFEATHDTAGMYVVHQARGQIANIHCDVAMAVTSFDAATAMARELGIDNDLVPQRANFRVLSAEPNSDTLRWFETEAAGHHADVDRCRAAMFAMMGRFDEARALLGDELRLAEGSEVSHLIGSLLSFEGVRIESLAGDYRAAVAFGERGCRYLEEVESWGVLSTGAGILARAQFYAGRLDKAEAWAERSRELGIVEDGYTQMLWRQARALVLAQRGDGADAEQLLHEALALGRKTNSPVLLGEVYFDLGNAMATLGERAKARAAYADAIALFDAKENIAMAEQTRARLASVSA